MANFSNATTAVAFVEKLRACRYKTSKILGGNAGIFLPIFGAGETEDWGDTLRAVLYALGLAWCFMGVAIIADVFMGAIEEITAKKKGIMLGDKQFYVKVWNDTVANLTLMALGSSAPEILLSVIEIIGNDFLAGDLGPSTIVGSAAFNLLMIFAVCIVSIPEGEVRTIKEMGVLGITSFFSLFAYLYMILVLQVFTPNVITLGEAIFTLVMFPMLVGLAWGADSGYFSLAKLLPHHKRVQPGNGSAGGTGGRILAMHGQTLGFNPKDIAEALKIINEEYGDRISSEQKQHLVAVRLLANAPKSRAYYRVKATRELLAGKRIQGVSQEKEGELLAQMERKIKTDQARARTLEASNADMEKSREEKVHHSEEAYASQTQTGEGEGQGETTVELSCTAVSVLEGAGHATLSVLRFGLLTETSWVYYYSEDGSADSGTDFEAVSGVLVFGPGEGHKTVDIQIFDDDQWEPDEDFFVKLALGPPEGKKLPSSVTAGSNRCVLGDLVETRVTIINDDEPGILQFGNDVRVGVKGREKFDLSVHKDLHGSLKGNCYVVTEGQPHVVVSVHRVNGASGIVTAEYYTQDHIVDSAVEGNDYTKAKGTLTFGDGELVKVIRIPIIEDENYERTEYFQVVLTSPGGGATFPADSDGGLNHEIAVVAIVDSGKVRGIVSRISASIGINADKMKLSTGNWAQQFRDAWNVNGANDEEGEEADEEKAAGGTGEINDCRPEAPGTYDWVMHIIALPWKLAFACCPPPAMAGGWPCFCISLIMTGMVTALIGDLASFLGCVIGMPDATTAITLVALGTSLPDTFASMAAAKGDKHADASIGNVTGSNSVNVFLGLGIPWLVASIIWGSRGQTAAWDTYLDHQSGLSASIAAGIRRDYPNGAFVVPAGKLSFSVFVFSGCTVLCAGLMLWRRKYAGGMLGGDKKKKYYSAAFLAFLWFSYIGLSAAKESDII